MDKEDMVYLYNGTFLSHKKEWNNAICRNMDGPRDYHTKSSKPDKDKYMISLTCGMLKKKMMQINLYTKLWPTHIENKLMVAKGKSGGKGDKLGIWD